MICYSLGCVSVSEGKQMPRHPPGKLHEVNIKFHEMVKLDIRFTMGKLQ